MSFFAILGWSVFVIAAFLFIAWWAFTNGFTRGTIYALEVCTAIIKKLVVPSYIIHENGIFMLYEKDTNKFVVQANSIAELYDVVSRDTTKVYVFGPGLVSRGSLVNETV